MSKERYVATVHADAKSAYLERLRNAEQQSLSIYEIGGKFVVASSIYAANMAFAQTHTIRKMSRDDLKDLNAKLLFALTEKTQ